MPERGKGNRNPLCLIIYLLNFTKRYDACQGRLSIEGIDDPPPALLVDPRQFQSLWEKNHLSAWWWPFESFQFHHQPSLALALLEADPCVPLLLLSRLPKVCCKVAGSRAAACMFSTFNFPASIFTWISLQETVKGENERHTQPLLIQPPCKSIQEI